MTRICHRLFISLMIVSVVIGLKQQIIPNLRHFSTTGWGGEFEANEEILGNEIRHRVLQDSVCGYEVLRELQDSFTKVTIFYATPVDHTFDETLSDSLKEKTATSFRQLVILANIVNDIHLQLVRFTNSTKRVLDPFATNYDLLGYIDSFEDDGEGHVMLRKGKDVLSLEYEDDPSYDQRESEEVKDEFKHIQHPQLMTTNYPLPFDWGCDFLGNEAEFCEELQNNCELKKAGSDVCNLIQSRYRSIGRASMRITNMTGYFRDAVPFLAPFQFPIVSFSAESFEEENTGGVIFPCLAGI